MKVRWSDSGAQCRRMLQSSKDVFRTCPGALRKASRQATERVGAGKTPVQKFLRDN